MTNTFDAGVADIGSLPDAARIFIFEAGQPAKYMDGALLKSAIAASLNLSSKADLVGGIVPSAQLPSFVDDVLEYANFAALPGSGETGKIYITIDDGHQHRWSGSAYVDITGSGGGGQTVDIQAALDGADTPSASNVFVTNNQFSTLNAVVLGLTDTNLGPYANYAAAKTAHPTGIVGQVFWNAETDTFWGWDVEKAGGADWADTNKDASGKTTTAQAIGASLAYMDVPITSNRMAFDGWFRVPVGDVPANGMNGGPKIRVGNGTTAQVTGYKYRTDGAENDAARTGLNSQDDTGITFNFIRVPENRRIRLSGVIFDGLDGSRLTAITVNNSDGPGATGWFHCRGGVGQPGTTQVDNFVRFRSKTDNGDIDGSFQTWDLPTT